MGIYKLLLPKMGESVSEATVTKWLKEVGDAVDADEAVVEIATDKVDSDVPSPVAGRLAEKLFAENQIEDAFPEAGSTDEHPVEEEKAEKPQGSAPIPGTELLEGLDDKEASRKTVLRSEDRFYSPLVKSIAQAEGLSQAELDGIAGTGLDGRVTKQDILDHLADGRKPSTEASATSPIIAERQNEPIETSFEASAGYEIVEMDRMRKLIADHMVHSVKTAPHVASFVEADVTNLVAWRNRVKDGYRKREGENMTFTPIFLDAIGRALRDFPMVNVSLDGHNIIKKKQIHIGMATALPSGNLIVPVIKNADRLNLAGLAKAVNDLAERARTNRLKPDDTQGGTFTFTNIGAFGNIMGIPIIHQPQSAILAAGAIKKRPVVLETDQGDVIAVRHIVYLSMSYDHRIIDGALGSTFLKRVADYLENWDGERSV